MSTFNSVVLLGHVAQTPKLRYAPDGSPLVDFDVVVNKGITWAHGSDARAPVSVHVTATRRMAELCAKFLKQGRQTLICGELSNEKKSGLTVEAREVKFMGPEKRERNA